MIKFKVNLIDLERVVKSVKKGIDKKGKDEFRGIRFTIKGDELIAYTSDGHKVFTNKCLISKKETMIEDGYEFISPLIRFPDEAETEVVITVDFDTKLIEYDFGKTKLNVEMYLINANIDYVKLFFDDLSEKDQVMINIDNLKDALNGFSKKETLKLSITKDKRMMLIETMKNKDNKRLVMLMR